MSRNSTRRPAPPEASIGPGEVVLRGTPIRLSTRAQLAEDAHRSVCVLGHRATASLGDDGKSVVVDTSALPPGRYVLAADELPRRKGASLPRHEVDFVVVDSPAKIPDGLALYHATRLRIGELDVRPAPMDGLSDGKFIDVFKAEERGTSTPVQVAYDERGRRVDVDKRLAQLAKRRLETFGRVHPTLHETIQRQDVVPVAVWFADGDGERERVEKSPKRAVTKRPKADAKAAESWRARAESMRATVEDLGLEVQSSTSTPR